jgi:hypothetical protein
MSRLTPWLIGLLLLVAACGDADPGAGSSGGAAVDSDITAAPDGAAEAPDFELALADGGTFRLSAESKPVYLIFWAEW